MQTFDPFQPTMIPGDYIPDVKSQQAAASSLRATLLARQIPEPHFVSVKHRKTGDERVFNLAGGYPGHESHALELLKGRWQIVVVEAPKAEEKKK